MTIKLNSPDLRIVTYKPGCSGHFLNRVLSNHLLDSLQVESKELSFVDGHAHNLAKNVDPYHLVHFSEQNPGKTIYDYDFKINLRGNLNTAGKKLVLLADLGGWDDDFGYFVSQFPNAKIVRVYANCFESTLVAVLNHFTKVGLSGYSNLIFDLDYVEQIRNRPGNFEDNVVDELVEVFKYDFNQYPGFRKPFIHERVYNSEYYHFLEYDLFCDELGRIAEFFDTEVREEGLKELYDAYYAQQKNFRYAFLSTAEVTKDDLVGRAVIKFYREYLDDLYSWY